MSISEAYDLLVKDREKKWEEYYATQKRIDDCNALLKRLKPVKEEIASLKYNFNYYVKHQDHYGISSDIWVGDQYQSFLAEMSGVEIENEDYYLHSLDFVLDTLNDQITLLENQCLSELGLLGDLLSVINYLTNEIENFFN